MTISAAPTAEQLCELADALRAMRDAFTRLSLLLTDFEQAQGQSERSGAAAQEALALLQRLRGTPR